MIYDIISHMPGIETNQSYIPQNQSFRDIPINPNLSDVLGKLIKKRDIIDSCEVTTFVGGPLDLRSRGIETSWLTPIEIQDEENSTYIHAIYINCNPESSDHAEKIFNSASETAIKLQDESDPSVQSLRHFFSCPNDQKQVIFRISRMGSFHIPDMITPFSQPEPDILQKHIRAAEQLLNTTIPITHEQIKSITSPPEIWSDDCGLCVIAKPSKHKTPVGDIFAYLIYNPEDPWQIYELYTHEQLQKINKRLPVNLRIDSGCDIGQLYSDEGCDCHSQLLRMLTHVVEEKGIVIHAPTQDGRGYGLATKMETEGMKRGIPVGLNGNHLVPMDTVAAGKTLLGEHYDTRTYEGIGIFLRQFGFSDVRIHTDNKEKYKQLKYSGINVTRIPTNTLTDAYSDDCKAHIKAKHNDPLYWGDSESEGEISE